MSFLGGAECSTAGNPLSQFTKHVQDDKSLQRDRLVGRGPGGAQESMRSHGSHLGQAPMDHDMQTFLLQHQNLQNQGFEAQRAATSPFAMEQMRRELEQTQRSGSPAWAAEFDATTDAPLPIESMHAAKAAGISPSEFARFHTHGASAARTSSPITGNQTGMMGYQRPMGYGMGMGMGMGYGTGMMNRSFGPMAQEQPGEQMEGKGKERMVELDDQDWEAQFAKLDSALDMEANAAIEQELNDLDRSVPSHLSETDHFGDFESIWRGIQAEQAQHDGRSLAEDGTFADPNGIHMGDMEQWEGFDGLNTHSSLRDPQLGAYLFEEHNLFDAVADPFREGVAIMEEGGNLSLAALAFEAAAHKDPQHVEAWVRLGSAQAQNEKESPAIRALEQALKLDPSNLEALMGLAVSYTNEGYDSTAYRTLERWIATKYPAVVSEPLSSPADLGFTDRAALHDKVTALFLAAAQRSPAGEAMDPDVQVGLGVLFYGAEEYDKAVDCFGAALASSETGTTNQAHTQHLLWNRLGATLANSGRPEEAIDAYERALALRPNFVRARYNLGVSCINIGCLPEAAQHLLGALAMHEVVAKEGRERARDIVGGDNVGEEELDRLIHQNQSTNLFDTLRRVFSQMGRRDLGDLVGPGMEIDKFRGEFEF